jgi:anti-sigma regulatory factor (Ser/Thr protein kinase)
MTSSSLPIAHEPEESGGVAYRALALLPTGRDAALACRILASAHMDTEVCDSVGDLCRKAGEGAGLAVIGAEAINDEEVRRLRRLQTDQPSWSELPIILLGTEQGEAVTFLEELGNVTLLDRPLRIAEFLAATHAALRSRRRQYQVRDLLNEIERTQLQQRVFLRDVLSAVTRGKLLLHDVEEPVDLPSKHSVWTFDLQQIEDITRLRRQLKETPLPVPMDADRWYDFTVAVGEASTNAILHGHGGQAELFLGKDRMGLRIQDHGPGISLENLPKATLQGGFSSARTLGMGFTAIVEFVDQVHLSTGINGTSVMLELCYRHPDSDDLLSQLMSAYKAD